MRPSLVALSLGLTIAMAACTTVPFKTAPEPAQSQTAAMSARERAQLAIKLLDAGQETQAMVEINAMLADNPADATALKLQRQVEGDPKKMLGARYKTYTVKPGDTISSLAKTYLGDAMLFYALSRYNDLAAPNRVAVGQSLKLPDSYSGAPKAAAVTAAEPKKAEPVRTVSAKDADAAKALRLEALEQLNMGNADRAVTLLSQAGVLDSGNPSIAADLARAQRIQRTLGAE